MTDEIITRMDGALGRIVLNRPQAINAMTLPMIEAVHQALDQWRDDPRVVAVSIEGAGSKGFCAGGDIRSIVHGARQDLAFGYRMFRAEYTLNYKIHTYPKPYIAWMHGIVMGGGAGVSVYGSQRIVTDTTHFAMPECAIGLFPDIGATWFLHRMPGMIGKYLALTGQKIDAMDCMALGIGTHYLPAETWPAAKAALTAIHAPTDIAGILAEFAQPTPRPSALLQQQSWIDDHFAGDDLLTILRGLPTHDHARDSHVMLHKNSPTSMAVLMESWRRGQGQNLAQILERDLLLSQHFLRNPDFYEGVRAAVIDKDRQPRWQPPQAEMLDVASINAYFDPIPGIDCAVFAQG